MASGARLETCDGKLEGLRWVEVLHLSFQLLDQSVDPSNHTHTPIPKHEPPPPAQPQLEKGFHAVQDAGHRVAEAAKPALQQAGEAIKSTSQHVVDKLQGKGGEGGGGAGGQPPHTV